jgi:hypothetical protein
MSLVPDYKNPAAEWDAAQQIHAIYSSLAREFALEVTPSQVLETGGETATDEALDSARQWLSRMDDRIEVHQLRQYLQNTQTANKDGVLVLLEHFLRKADQRPSDRDKVDFLLVQHFFNNAPSLIKDGNVELKYVAEIVKPVIGPVSVTTPEWLKPLDSHIEKAASCKSLNELFQSGALESARKLKTSSDHNYFDPTALVAFTRFNFLVRRIFFRLLHQDINGILDGLRELEQRGVQVLDCRRAEFSAEEPILRLRMICQSWKVMFQAEYSLGQPLRLLTELRGAVDAALAQQQPAEIQAEKSEDNTVSADGSQEKGQSKKSRRARAAAAASAASAHNHRAKDTEPNADKSRHDSKRK